MRRILSLSPSLSLHHSLPPSHPPSLSLSLSPSPSPSCAFSLSTHIYIYIYMHIYAQGLTRDICIGVDLLSSSDNALCIYGRKRLQITNLSLKRCGSQSVHWTHICVYTYTYTYTHTHLYIYIYIYRYRYRYR